MANRWFTKIFGTRFNRELKRIQPIVDAIHEHEVRLKEIGGSELQAQTAKFREAIAQRTGALIVCGYCERLAPGRFRIVMEPALDPASFPTASALNAAVASTVERHIREHLDQWCIFRPLWEAVALPASEPEVTGHRVEA